MTRFTTLFLAFGCLFVLSPAFTPLNAQVAEICDNGVDDDGDKLIDCDDPDCVCTPKEVCDNAIDDDGDGLVDCDDPDCECVKKEICDNKIDDDGDGLIDCDDPDCDCPPPPEGVPCSHGFWKNHTELWFGVCCTGDDCDQLLADLKAKGPGSEAIRQAAADFLEACLGRPCDESGEEESRTVGDAIRDLNLLFCSSTPAPAIAGSEDKNELRPADVTGTVENLHRVFGGV